MLNEAGVPGAGPRARRGGLSGCDAPSRLALSLIARPAPPAPARPATTERRPAQSARATHHGNAASPRRRHHATTSAHCHRGLTQALVTRVVDGDTIDVEIDGEELHASATSASTRRRRSTRAGRWAASGREASEHNSELVEGKTVGLEKDVSETDRLRPPPALRLAGRRDGERDARRGGLRHAVHLPAGREVPGARSSASQAEARDAGRGLWGAACASPRHAPVGRRAAPATTRAPTEPVIKGNISRARARRSTTCPAASSTTRR